MSDEQRKTFDAALSGAQPRDPAQCAPLHVERAYGDAVARELGQPNGAGLVWFIADDENRCFKAALDAALAFELPLDIAIALARGFTARAEAARDAIQGNPGIRNRF